MGELINADLPFDAGIDTQRDSEDGVEDLSTAPASGGGLKIRQLTGGIISDGHEPSTAEYQSAISTAYTSAETEPQFGDLISLRVSGGSRLVARFWILKDDQSATNATIAFSFSVGDPPVSTTFYALNISYAPLEQIIDALQDYFAGPDGGQEPDGRDIEPEGDAPFAISVNGNYSTGVEGFLVPNNTVDAFVNQGTVKVIEDQPTANISAIGPTGLNFPPYDGKNLFAVTLLLTMPLDAAGGTISSVSGSMQFKYVESGDAVPPVVTDMITVNNVAYKKLLVGTIALKRTGNRRWVGITQTFAGNIDLFGGLGSGVSTVVDGVNLAAGPRKVTLCVNGKPYKCSILTGPLTKVT